MSEAETTVQVHRVQIKPTWAWTLNGLKTLLETGKEMQS
jgi:hypothetical protein